MESNKTTQHTHAEEEQAQQGSGSALAEKPKDNKPNKTERRSFLKTAGMSAIGLGALSKLSKLEAAEIAEPDKSLLEELSRFEDDEKVELAEFLKRFNDDRWIFGASMKELFWQTLNIVQQKKEALEKKQKAEQKERRYRDSLTGQAKVDYLVSQLTEACQFYCPPFQREILDLVAKGTPSSADWKTTHDTTIYAVGTINQVFEGCSKRLRQKVIAQYLKDVLPAHEARYEKENADMAACDELLALTEGKTPKEIRAMTTLLRGDEL